MEFEKLLEIVENPVMRQALEKALKEKLFSAIKESYQRMFERILVKREGRKVYVVYVFRDEGIAEAFEARLKNLAGKIREEKG